MAKATPRPGLARDYKRGWLRGDLLAGVTVTAYLIPQVMAYAEVAGLPAVTGLWASVGALARVRRSSAPRRSCRSGPESTTALMTAAALGSAGRAAEPTAYADLAAALCLVVAVLLPARLAGRGWRSWPTCSPGRCSSATWPGSPSIMVVSQLGKLTGITVEAEGFLPQVWLRRPRISTRCTSRRWCWALVTLVRDARRQRRCSRGRRWR